MTASGPEVRSTDTAPPRHSAEMNPWARGLAVFAAVMMMTVGVLHVIAGLVALFENEFYVAGADSFSSSTSPHGAGYTCC